MTRPRPSGSRPAPRRRGGLSMERAGLGVPGERGPGRGSVRVAAGEVFKAAKDEPPRGFWGLPGASFSRAASAGSHRTLRAAESTLEARTKTL